MEILIFRNFKSNGQKTDRNDANAGFGTSIMRAGSAHGIGFGRRGIYSFFGITAISAAALGWSSWQLVGQDRALAAQRAQEQREHAVGAK